MRLLAQPSAKVPSTKVLEASRKNKFHGSIGGIHGFGCCFRCDGIRQTQTLDQKCSCSYGVKPTRHNTPYPRSAGQPARQGITPSLLCRKMGLLIEIGMSVLAPSPAPPTTHVLLPLFYPRPDKGKKHPIDAKPRRGHRSAQPAVTAPTP